MKIKKTILFFGAAIATCFSAAHAAPQAVPATLDATSLNPHVRAAATISSGINYSPFHNPSFKTSDVLGRRAILTRDFSVIANNGFKVVKTFYSTYSTDSGDTVAVAPIAATAGLKLVLGVYEFTPNDGCSDTSTCELWTKVGVELAVAQAQQYPDTVVAIAVGNEDIADWQGNFQPDMIQRITADINQIKQGLQQSGLNIPVTTPQRKSDWDQVARHTDNPGLQAALQALVNAVDILAINDYPYWGNSPEACVAGTANCAEGQSVAVTIPFDLQSVEAEINQAFNVNKDGIIAEEGWPSAGNPDENNAYGVPQMADYYSAWRARSQSGPASFYFAMFDNLDPDGTGSDANNHFGLCSAGGISKSQSNGQDGLPTTCQ